MLDLDRLSYRAQVNYPDGQQEELLDKRAIATLSVSQNVDIILLDADATEKEPQAFIDDDSSISSSHLNDMEPQNHHDRPFYDVQLPNLHVPWCDNP